MANVTPKTDAIQAYFGNIDFDPEALRAKYLAERDKRIRDDGIDQYIDVGDDFATYAEDPYTPITPRQAIAEHTEMIIIGGGFGGLLMAARAHEVGVTDIRMIETGGDFGGTWYWNRYPGAMCDVESYCYLPLLEELNYIPKHRYSFAPEILEHSRNIARHFNLYDKACLHTSVTDIRWQEGEQHWLVETNRGDRLTADFIAMATGPLSRPKLPGIPGIKDFQGHTFHTSRWDYDYTGGDASGGLVNLRDKRVGIIGTGATAVQCIPHLGEWAKQLYIFQRTPSSIDVRGNRPTDMEWAKSLKPGWQAERMANFTSLVSGLEQPHDLIQDGWTDIYTNLTGSAAAKAEHKLGRKLGGAERAQLLELADHIKMNSVRDRVDAFVSDPRTAEALKPWYRQLCKRPCFHDEYLDTFSRESVQLVDSEGLGVERVTEDAAWVNGQAYPVDVLIFATGFEVGTAYHRRAGYDIAGERNLRLSEHWQDGPRTLHGVVSHGFPNCFYLGFTQGVVTVNVPHALNEQAKHIAYMIGEMKRQGAKTVAASEQGEADYLAEVQAHAHLGARFYAECTPGYYNGEGHPNEERGFFSHMHNMGAMEFFAKLEAWRQAGDSAGIEYLS